jgi:hypothetical protein
MMSAVAKVDENPDHHPDDESDPGIGGKKRHHEQAGDHTEYRDEWNHWHPEGSWRIGLFYAKHPRANADKHKSEKSTDAHHFADDVRGNKRREKTDEDHKQKIRFVRCLKLRMNVGE